MAFCRNCGHELADDASYCGNCGTPVASSDTDEAPRGAIDAAATGNAAEGDAPREDGSDEADDTFTEDPNGPATAAPAAPQPDAAPIASPAQKRPLRGKTVAVAAALVAVLAAGGGAGYYFGVYLPEQERIEADRIAHSVHAMRISVEAEGWDTASGASRLPVQVTGTDLDGKDVDEVQYVDSDGAGIELIQGEYRLRAAASPIASDGGIYDVPDTELKVEIGEDAGDGEDVDLSGEQRFELTATDAVSVTDEQIDAAYKYASQDKGAKDAGITADADALKQAATKRRDDAVAKKKAEEEAARKKAEEEAAKKKAEEARKAAANTYSDGEYFSIVVPEQFSGKWTVEEIGVQASVMYSFKLNGAAWFDISVGHLIDDGTDPDYWETVGEVGDRNVYIHYADNQIGAEAHMLDMASRVTLLQ